MRLANSAGSRQKPQIIKILIRRLFFAFVVQRQNIWGSLLLITFVIDALAILSNTLIILFLSKILKGITSEYSTCWIQIMPSILFGQISVYAA